MPKVRCDPSSAVTKVVEHLFALPHFLLSDEDDDHEDWINLVAKSASDLFVKEVQSIPKFTPVGLEQLGTDVDAFSNLLAALGLPNKAVLQIKEEHKLK